MSRNAPCLLLNKEENNQLFGLLGRNCTTQASAVVQLFDADSPTARWRFNHSGVVCFIKDGAKKSYYIRLYDIAVSQMVWEQEIYTRFKYKTPRDFFHTFEGDSAMVGLNFASEDEAGKFRDAVLKRLQERDRRKEMRKEEIRRRKMANAAPQEAPPVVHTLSLPESRGPPPSSPTPASPSKGSGKDKKGKKLSKTDIGGPSDFRVVSRLGWDPEKGFDSYNLDPTMEAVFKAVGITNKEEANPATVEFIYDFVEKNGGLDVLRQELSTQPPPTPPPDAPPPAVPRRPSDTRPLPPAPSEAPPLPSHRPSCRRRPPQPPSSPPADHGPLPPAPPGRGPPPPRSPPSHTPAPGIPPAPPAPAAPPAPPCPPPPGPGGPPAPPVKSASTPAKTPAPAPVIGRDALHRQIHEGIKLKRVDVVDGPKPAGGERAAGGLLGTLQEALIKNRYKLSTPIEDDSDEDGSDVDEWSD